MKFQDIETGEIRTRGEWVSHLEREARANHGDAYAVTGEDLFQALRDDLRLVEV